MFSLAFASTDSLKMEMFFSPEYSSNMLYLEFTVLVFVKIHDLEIPAQVPGFSLVRTQVHLKIKFSGSSAWIVDHAGVLHHGSVPVGAPV